MSELVEVEPVASGDSETEQRAWYKDRCFKWHEDRETGELHRGRWDVSRTADTVETVIRSHARLSGPVGFPKCIGRGIDGRLWVFESGVWKPGERQIHEAFVWVLQDEFNINRENNTLRFLAGSADLPIIDGTPASAWLNFRNGMLHWETGVFYGHNPRILTTVQLGCDWNPDATCEPWLRFLEQVLPADALDTFQEILGYLMFSGEPLHKAFMFNGSGRNGKGTTLGVIQALLGDGENVSHVSLQDLAVNRFKAARLMGRLANIVGDMSASFVKDTDTFKSATGGDTIDGEYKGKDSFAFTPFASHVFSTNKLPTFADTSTGFIDRWVVVPFPHTCPEEKRDPSLKAQLCEPASLEGIAVWALVGLQRVMARGRFDLPPSMITAKEEFAVAVHPVRAFLRECAVRAPGDRVPTTQVYALYAAWLAEQHRKGAGKLAFYAELEALGIERGTHHGTEVFKDLRLIKSPMDYYVDIW